MTQTLSSHKHFGTLSFYKKALALAIPVMAQLFIQNLVSLIDNFMVSGLGDVKMSGVNICGQILFIFMVLLNTLCMAGGIFMAQFNGANDKKGMQQSFRFKLLMGGVSIIIYTIVCMIIPKQVLSLMVHKNIQADAILSEGVKYMFLMGFIGIPMVISASISSSLREIGKVKAPLIISVIATCINTFFNWVFIYGNLGAPRLEVQGAALATIIARVVEMILFMLYVSKKKPAFAFKLIHLFKLDRTLSANILKKGGMMLFSEMLWVISETITTALYNQRGGADVVSGMAASFAIANLFFVAFSGIGTATSVIMGSTLGKDELDEARRQKSWILNGVLIFGVFMGLLGLLTILLVPVVFVNLSAGAQQITKEMVFVQALYMPAWAYVNGQFAISRAGGDTVMGMWVDGISNIGLVIPGMFVMALATPIGPVEMYTIIKVVDFVKIAIAAIWLKKEHWVKNLAIENKQVQ